MRMLLEESNVRIERACSFDGDYAMAQDGIASAQLSNYTGACSSGEWLLRFWERRLATTRLAWNAFGSVLLTGKTTVAKSWGSRRVSARLGG
jgi:hypothetical protein